jgi:hypothetical protein
MAGQATITIGDRQWLADLATDTLGVDSRDWAAFQRYHRAPAMLFGPGLRA